MRYSHTLCRIGDQVTGHERILHADVPHGYTITYRYRRENHRISTCFSNAELYGFSDFVDIHMAWNYLIIRADDSDQRLVYLFLCKSESIQETPRWCLLHASLHVITLHTFLPFYI